MKELEDIIWQLECIYRRTGDLDVGIEMLRLRFFKHNQERKMKKYRYSSFKRFRIWLASLIGLDLQNMEGYCEDGIKCDTVDDHLKYLLNHSGCEGELHPHKCEMLYLRLKNIIKDREITNDIFSLKCEEDWYYMKAKIFMDGCYKAYKNNEFIEFH